METNEALIEKSGSQLKFIVDGYPNIYLFDEKYYDFSQVDLNELFEIHHFGDFIYKILQSGKELKKVSKDVCIDFIENRNNQYFLKEKGIKMPKNFNFSNTNLNLPFVAFLNQKSGIRLLQNGSEIEKYDANSVVNTCLISENNISNDLKEKKKDDIAEAIEKDPLSIFKVGLNYDNKQITIESIFSNQRLPIDTLELIGNLDSDNFSLELNKKPYIIKQNGKLKFQLDIKKLDGWNNYGSFIDFNKICERHLKNVKSIFGKQFIENSFKPDWRVIVGLGTDSVYETGITLHHVYGFPYIPASAIKGITRSYMITEKFNCNESDAFQDELFCDIFGSVDQSCYEESRMGKITFFDAMPLTPPKIKPDIMNVHYPDYYGEGKAPTDTQKLNPIFFLTVEDTEFQFILGCKDKESKDLLKTAFEWMKKALSNKGIGAKTAVGYGYFSET